MIFSAWYKIFSFKKILMMSDIAKKERITKLVMIEDQSHPFVRLEPASCLS
ncbi:MAG: hypothetical protein K0S91_2080 [Nitrososphaeraceae archaeon]|nr:hypothetical protein [Nitrososphaeraceae archaeon]